MVSGVRYRVFSTIGAIAIIFSGITAANSFQLQSAVSTTLPVLSRLSPSVLPLRDILVTYLLSAIILSSSLGPLFKPQSRRPLDIISLTQRRVLLGSFVLATIGYYDYSYRLPRLTLIILTALLLVTLPMWFLLIRRRPVDGHERAVIIGNNAEEMESILKAVNTPIIGYVSPSSQPERPMADGGALLHQEASDTSGLNCLGGLAKLDEILVNYDVDTAIFAFTDPNRTEFFGALAECHDQGVVAKIHRDSTDSVLAHRSSEGILVRVDLEPWDWQDRVLKRLFDVCFAAIALLCTLPLTLLIAAAIKLDSSGPVLYSQKRTAELGDTFTVYKFRSMIQNAENVTGAVISNEDAGDVDHRVTKVGSFLRQTHLDELPQLWSILRGEMSVVGPRPERPELEGEIQDTVSSWRQRWFVKPGLTGLAQINGVTGKEPAKKLRYDVAYIRNQSLRYDAKIVIRQLLLVAEDALGYLDD